ncbi:VOC family protein [Haloplasma contractile]|uniref:Lactoylglutathione lyase protein n=1 Tax=Haloplasma contractile SSD-17B TaxID=1033810 RepID=U2EAH7_9MOLU|nr:VOC family protein [Haloplasma contractile]ERJ12103.1 lactoylglutathione lyase protein [Haloplasma contractile SSD-17B]
MFTNIATVAIYVDRQEEAQEFWTKKVGFKTIREDQMNPHQFWIEVAPSLESKTRLLIYSREMMLEDNPDAICHPSIVFDCEQIDGLRQKLKDNGVSVGPVQNMHYGKFFELQDNEGNSYLVREQK